MPSFQSKCLHKTQNIFHGEFLEQPQKVKDREIMHPIILIFSDEIFTRLFQFFSSCIYIITFFFFSWQAVPLYFLLAEDTLVSNLPQNMLFPVLSWAVSCIFFFWISLLLCHAEILGMYSLYHDGGMNLKLGIIKQKNS